METPSPPSRASDTLSSDHYQSGRDSVEHLLSHGSTTRDSESPSYGPRRTVGLSLAALLPLATVLLWSFGMGSGLLIWLLVGRIPAVPGVSSRVFDGFIVVDEGNKTSSTQPLDGQEDIESNLRGMLIINTISIFSGVVLVPLMALGAFNIAAKWLDDQANSKDAPTPLQLGLIMKMCSEGTLKSLFTTFKYLITHQNTNATTRTRVSPVFYRTLTITSTVVVLHYAVKATDLWLTGDLGSAYYSRISEVDIAATNSSALGTQYNTSFTNEEYELSFLAAMKHTVGTNQPTDDNYFYQSLDAMSGRWTRDHLIFVNTSSSSSLDDTSSTVIIVRPPSMVPSQWSWTAPTIGLTVRCQPAPCDRGYSSNTTNTICPIPSGTYPPMPLPSFRYMSSYFINNATTYNPTTGEDSSVDWKLPSPAGTNPTYGVIQLNLENIWDMRADDSEIGSLHSEEGGFSYLLYLGTCEITLHDVEVSFTTSPSFASKKGSKDAESQYSITSNPVPMSNDRASHLLTPLLTTFSTRRYSILSYFVMDILQTGVKGDTVSPAFSKRVSAEFARICLAFISPICEAIPAKQITDHSPKLVSRYPTVATMSYIVVVYAHGLLAIVLFIGIVGRSSKTIVVGDPGWRVNWRGKPMRERQKQVPELLLVHSRLTDPLTVIAELFLETVLDDIGQSEKRWDASPSDTHTSAGALSARRMPMDMFGVESDSTMRVEVGLMDKKEGGRRFGMKQKSVRLVEVPDSRNRT